MHQLLRRNNFLQRISEADDESKVQAQKFLTELLLKFHKDEIMNLIQNIIKEGEIRSPLKKVIDFTQKDQEVSVSLTDNHLARHIGDALYKAYNGVLEVKYSEEEKFVRLYWHRDA